MLESSWRSKLVDAFRKNQPRGFIWVNDVRYKAGFPDIYIVLNCICRHYELKVCPGREYTNQMTVLQEAVCRRMAAAGVHVSCISLIPQMHSVVVKNFNEKKTYTTSQELLVKSWSEGHLI